MVKTAKVYLICRKIAEKGRITEAEDSYYKKVNQVLWELQKQTRIIKNKTIQLCWEWCGFASNYNKQNGEYPKPSAILDYKSLSGYAYDCLKEYSDMQTSNLSGTIRTACTEFENAKKEILMGTKSIIQYKSDQPLELCNSKIQLFYDKDNHEYQVKLFVLSKAGAVKFETGNTAFAFKAVVKDNSTKTILERCIDGIYKISGSKLMYDRKKRMWYLNLCYGFENQNKPKTDPDKILGINLGVAYPIVASVQGEWKRFVIEGGELEHFRASTEARRISMLKQGKVCGDGRIGHGIKARNKPVYRMEDKVARFRNTINHRYSRALVDYAVRNQCGTIQMEDLTGITADANRFMKNWSYYDLQQKIEYKAKEQGISVVYIEPKYTTARCSKCGCIHEENILVKERKFKCIECGFETFQDYNASQNIAVRDIDKVISAELEESNIMQKKKTA